MRAGLCVRFFVFLMLLGGVARRLRIHLDMRPPSRPAAAGPTAHFDPNESHVIYGTGH